MIPIEGLELGDGVSTWFTGRDPDLADPPIGRAGNLAHRRPHRPDDLAAAREAVGERTGTDPSTWHLMQQVHGRSVGVVTASTPVGAELRGVDALVTAQTDRPLGVFVADCVPVMFAAPSAVGVVHAGRLGTASGVVDAAVGALSRLDPTRDAWRVVIGPAIRGCCYEVPLEMRDEFGVREPDAVGTTSWGSPSLDLPAAVRAQLIRAGVGDVRDVGVCTRCDQRWFSHRRDPDSGRQLGLVVRRAGDQSRSREAAQRRRA